MDTALFSRTSQSWGKGAGRSVSRQHCDGLGSGCVGASRRGSKLLPRHHRRGKSNTDAAETVEVSQSERVEKDGPSGGKASGKARR